MSYCKYTSLTGPASSWKAPVANMAALPATGNTNGDVIVAQDTGTIWVWVTNAWISNT